jgi:hypothetical protein
MKLFKVPMLNDYPDFRGNFIRSTTTNDMAFLDGNGKMFLLNAKVQEAILSLFDQAKDHPSIARPTVSIEAYVTSIERLAKALR